MNVNGTNPVAPYSSWATAATNIQDAINAAYLGGTVLVTDGVYQVGGETINGYALSNRVVINKQITVQSVNGPGNTTIQGYQIPTGAIYGLGNSAVRCVCITTNAMLAGFTLTGGATRNASGNGVNEQCGGGLWCISTNGVVISNCVITANNSYDQGGGISIKATLVNTAHNFAR